MKKRVYAEMFDKDKKFAESFVYYCKTLDCIDTGVSSQHYRNILVTITNKGIEKWGYMIHSFFLNILFLDEKSFKWCNILVNVSCI